ncbi:MAG TPA: MFS transporter [Acidobacteriota bacterium]|nr:MFS transporter [Acidobacteriota bacterium]
MWWREATAVQRRALLAASLGWMLDSMDILLYSMVLTYMMRDLGMHERLAGFMASLTLVSSAVGGILFGILADRLGRSRSLMASILVYSIFTAACGLSQNVVQLGLFRVLLGLGMGGEWACGAALVAETWPSRHRGKALGMMQSSWAIGYGLAAALTALVLPRFGWRAVFFAGILPALATLWIQKYVPEPEIWRRSKESEANQQAQIRLRDLLQGDYRKHILVTSLANAGTMFAWWGLFTWIPAFLSLPPDRGGAGLSVLKTSTWIILMQVGMWLGYVSFGFVSDRIGRRRAYVGYIFAAAALVPVYAGTRAAIPLLLIGPLVGFFGTGYFSGFGAITAEIFPTAVRASAQGLTYNLGRGVSAAAPYLVGSLGARYGLGFAFLLTSGSFLLAGLIALLIPETRGRELQ